MVSITKQGDSAVKFVFTDSQHYLYGDGTIEVPVNSLLLIVDESDMITFKKADGDPFISFNINDSNFSSKNDLIAFYKENMVGGGTDVETVQELIDASISGKVDTSAFTAYSASVETALSGKQDVVTFEETTTKSITVELEQGGSGVFDFAPDAPTTVRFTGATNQMFTAGVTFGTPFDEFYQNYSIQFFYQYGEDVQIFNNGCTVEQETIDNGANIVYTITSPVPFEKVSVMLWYANQTEGRVDISPFEYEVVTSTSLKDEVEGKQDILSAGTNITISGNVISANVPQSINVVQTTGSSTADVMSQSAVTTVINTVTAAIPSTYISDVDIDADQGHIRFVRFSTPSIFNYFILDNPKINGTPIHIFDAIPSNIHNFSLVETSAITTSISSSSTDDDIPTAKAVYDALSTGGGGSDIIDSTNIDSISGSVVANQGVYYGHDLYKVYFTKTSDQYVDGWYVLSNGQSYRFYGRNTSTAYNAGSGSTELTFDSATNVTLQVINRQVNTLKEVYFTIYDNSRKELPATGITINYIHNPSIGTKISDYLYELSKKNNNKFYAFSKYSGNTFDQSSVMSPSATLSYITNQSEKRTIANFNRQYFTYEENMGLNFRDLTSNSVWLFDDTVGMDWVEDAEQIASGDSVVEYNMSERAYIEDPETFAQYQYDRYIKFDMSELRANEMGLYASDLFSSTVTGATNSYNTASTFVMISSESDKLKIQPRFYNVHFDGRDLYKTPLSKNGVVYLKIGSPVGQELTKGMGYGNWYRNKNNSRLKISTGYFKTKYTFQGAIETLNSKFGGLKLVKLTQSEYDALVTKDSNTLFVIV